MIAKRKLRKPNAFKGKYQTPNSKDSAPASKKSPSTRKDSENSNSGKPSTESTTTTQNQTTKSKEKNDSTAPNQKNKFEILSPSEEESTDIIVEVESQNPKTTASPVQSMSISTLALDLSIPINENGLESSRASSPTMGQRARSTSSGPLRKPARADSPKRNDNPYSPRMNSTFPRKIRVIIPPIVSVGGSLWNSTVSLANGGPNPPPPAAVDTRVLPSLQTAAQSVVLENNGLMPFAQIPTASQ